MQTDNEPRPPNPQPATIDTPRGDLDETAPNRIEEAAPSIIAGTSVASLLSQLQPFNGALSNSSLPSDTPEYDFGHYQNGEELPYPPPAPRYVPAATNLPTTSPLIEDQKNLSFRESLPIISNLVKDSSFVTKIHKVSLRP